MSGTSDVPENFETEFYGVIVGEIGNPNTDYVSKGKVKSRPQQPSFGHVFDYSTEKWVVNLDLAWEKVRQLRDQLLAASDWRVTKAFESGETLAPEWVAYRAALRNITKQKDPLKIEWPVEPS